MTGPTSPPAIARLNERLRHRIREVRSAAECGRGTIEAVTTTPAASTAQIGSGPVTLAFVRFDDGTAVLAPVTDAVSRPPRRGSRVEFVVRRISVPNATAAIMYGLKARVLEGPESGNSDHTTAPSEAKEDA